ncbi:hypothetical protein PR048_016981 [Dryococelus australis]|uniref:Uncharacterized protein n=1 Tax=Dryococelus australis TaxID=614101 RepID=A0ABQ9H8B3_9NEOP|nr:hypothetical protein PR048_016981 [Dryococelus australis]
MGMKKRRMEQRWNARAGETGDPRENPSTSGIVRHDCHMRVEERDVARAWLPGHVRACLAAGLESWVNTVGLSGDTQGTAPPALLLVKHPNTQYKPRRICRQLSSLAWSLQPASALRFFARRPVSSPRGWRTTVKGVGHAGAICLVAPRGNNVDQDSYLKHSPTTQAILVPDEASFLGDLPFSPHLPSGAVPCSPCFTLIGSQDLDVKSSQNFFTHLLKRRSILVLFTVMFIPVCTIRVPDSLQDTPPPLTLRTINPERFRRLCTVCTRLGGAKGVAGKLSRYFIASTSMAFRRQLATGTFSTVTPSAWRDQPACVHAIKWASCRNSPRARGSSLYLTLIYKHSAHQGHRDDPPMSLNIHTSLRLIKAVHDKGRESCKEACIAAERDWAAMTNNWGNDYLPKRDERRTELEVVHMYADVLRNHFLFGWRDKVIMEQRRNAWSAGEAGDPTRTPADQRNRLERFPHAKTRGRSRRESNPVCLGGMRRHVRRSNSPAQNGKKQDLVAFDRGHIVGATFLRRSTCEIVRRCVESAPRVHKKKKTAVVQLAKSARTGERKFRRELNLSGAICAVSAQFVVGDRRPREPSITRARKPGPLRVDKYTDMKRSSESFVVSVSPFSGFARFWERAPCLIGYCMLRKVTYWLAAGFRVVTPDLCIMWLVCAGAINGETATCITNAISPMREALNWHYRLPPWRTGFDSGRIAPEFSPVVIVPDDAACIPALLPTHLGDKSHSVLEVLMLSPYLSRSWEGQERLLHLDYLHSSGVI